MVSVFRRQAETLQEITEIATGGKGGRGKDRMRDRGKQGFPRGHRPHRSGWRTTPRFFRVAHTSGPHGHPPDAISEKLSAVTDRNRSASSRARSEYWPHGSSRLSSPSMTPASRSKAPARISRLCSRSGRLSSRPSRGNRPVSGGKSEKKCSSHAVPGIGPRRQNLVLPLAGQIAAMHFVQHLPPGQAPGSG